jgi:NADP-dependent 3-hydroxy acid dehydrogenase YdfG
VCAVGRTAKTLETLVTSLPEGAALSVVADVANHDQVFEAVAAAARYGDGVLDIIVNNAGIGRLEQSRTATSRTGKRLSR